MSKTGLDWYKREPLAYLSDTQGLTAREHAVYSVVIELLYVHGGEINNDPKWISGWISDMGTAAIRNSLASLALRDGITLEISETKISQKRAKNEAKTKQKLRENAKENGEKGGKSSAKSRSESKQNNGLGQAKASTEHQADKRRVEKKEPKGSSQVTQQDSLGGLTSSSSDTGDEVADVLLEVCSNQVAIDFVAHRREIKKPLTARAARAMVNKVRGHPNPDAVLNESIAQGWQGIFPDKVSAAQPEGASNDRLSRYQKIIAENRAYEQRGRLQ
ncbi:hypothetical protein NBRC116590_02960 [Pelagimonas sp. KU-00592-HH]|uniref:DUF1376 domain-containing protein n=1 Tax=Pelagimonas sp. KU-00592-HH TaxID=3127651 RepID=UPI00310567FF